MTMQNLPRISTILFYAVVGIVAYLSATGFDVAGATGELAAKWIVNSSGILAILKVVQEMFRSVDASDPMIGGEEYHTRGRGVTLPAFWRRVL